MTPTSEHEQARAVLEQAMKLPPAVREAVALELLDSVDEGPPDTRTDEEIAAEIRRRSDDYHAGRGETLTRAESDARIRDAIRKLGFELP